jgi:phage shock protein C
MSIHDNLTRNGLVRPVDGRVLGGVCAGLGRRFGLEPWPARLLFILVLMVLPGSQLLIYPILWILMPSEVRYAPYPGQQAPYPGQQSDEAYPTAPAYPAPAYPAPAYAAPAYAVPADTAPAHTGPADTGTESPQPPRA